MGEWKILDWYKIPNKHTSKQTSTSSGLIGCSYKGKEKRGKGKILYNFHDVYKYTTGFFFAVALEYSFPMPLLIFISSHDRRAEMQIWPEVSIESLIPRCSLRRMALLLWKKLKIFKNASMSMQMHIFNIIILFKYSIYKF